MLDDLDLSGITDPAARQVVARLLQVIEQQAAQIAALKTENQQLRDERQRLKGEQGKPRILAKKRQRTDQSSERERRETPKAWHKGAKLASLPVTREEFCRLDPARLPADARLKDYVHVTVQDVVLQAETVRFVRERWEAASTGQTYTAPLPPGYAGAFGPNLKATAVYLCYAANISQRQVRQLFSSLGISISAGYLAGLLTGQPAFAAEAEAIGQAGLATSRYAHLDVTPTRVAGVEQECHVLGGPHYVFYHTSPRKDRLSAIEALQLGAPCRFCLNAAAWDYLAWAGLPASAAALVRTLPQQQVWDRAAWVALLDEHLGWLGCQARRRLTDAAAIGAYYAQRAVATVEILVCDDAAAFKGITADLALCWVHEGRHYKKLLPVLPADQQALTTFLDDFWAYYRHLRAYQAAPTAADATRLAAAFDTLFSRVTGYDALDDRIAKTRAKKVPLLRVLDLPFLPLTNNPAELGARRRVRKRDVSFGARSPTGIQAWDIFHTIVGTAQLLGVNVLHYLQDRFSGAFQLPALADLIRQSTPTQTAASDVAAA
jgi:Transposase IS66 family